MRVMGSTLQVYVNSEIYMLGQLKAVKYVLGYLSGLYVAKINR